MFARFLSQQKRRKRVVATADSQVTPHRTIELGDVFETVELLEGIAFWIPPWQI